MTVIKLIGTIGWDVTARQIIGQINRADGDIEIHADSMGGDLFEAFSIANAIDDYDKGTITIIVNVSAISAMSYILCKADKVIVHENTVFMMHNPSGGAWGDYRAVGKLAKELHALSTLAVNAYATKSSKSKEDIVSLMDETTYYYGQEIIDNGFADEILASAGKATMNAAKAISVAMLDFENLQLDTKKPLHTMEEYETLVSACGGHADCELMAAKMHKEAKKETITMEQPQPSEKAKESRNNTGDDMPKDMTEETFKTEHPELAASMQAEGKRSFQDAVKATMKELTPEQLQTDGVIALVMDGGSVADVKAHLYDMHQKELKDKKTTMLEEGTQLADDVGGINSTPPETETQKTAIAERTAAMKERRAKKKGDKHA